MAPHLANAYHNRGACHTALGDFQHALADYAHELMLDPSRAVAYFNRGFVHSIQHDWEEAVADYTRAIRRMPEFPAAFIHRSEVFRARGDYPAAVRDFAEALRLCSANTRAARLLREGTEMLAAGNDEATPHCPIDLPPSTGDNPN